MILFLIFSPSLYLHGFWIKVLAILGCICLSRFAQPINKPKQTQKPKPSNQHQPLEEVEYKALSTTT